MLLIGMYIPMGTMHMLSQRYPTHFIGTGAMIIGVGDGEIHITIGRHIVVIIGDLDGTVVMIILIGEIIIIQHIIII